MEKCVICLHPAASHALCHHTQTAQSSRQMRRHAPTQLTYHFFTVFVHLFLQCKYSILMVYFHIIHIAYPVCILRDDSIFRKPVISMCSTCDTVEVSIYLSNSSCHLTRPPLTFHNCMSFAHCLNDSYSEHLQRLYSSISPSQLYPPGDCWISTVGGCQGQSAPGVWCCGGDGTGRLTNPAGPGGPALP